MPMYDRITPEQADLIANSHVFFVASVHPDLTTGPSEEGPVNLSPKGGVVLHVINDLRVAYLDYPGSGDETARHAQANGPITLMVMSMEAENAAIVRLYGYATASPADESPLAERILSQPAEHLNRPRQIIDVRVESTQTSCGYGVPVYEYIGQRAKNGRGRRYKQLTR